VLVNWFEMKFTNDCLWNAKTERKPIDGLKLVCSWDAALLPKSCTVRAVVEGLLLQGCGFHNNVLSRLQADSPSMELLPPCVIAFIDKVSSILTIRLVALVLWCHLLAASHHPVLLLTE